MRLTRWAPDFSVECFDGRNGFHKPTSRRKVCRPSRPSPATEFGLWNLETGACFIVGCGKAMSGTSSPCQANTITPFVMSYSASQLMHGTRSMYVSGAKLPLCGEESPLRSPPSFNHTRGIKAKESHAMQAMLRPRRSPRGWLLEIRAFRQRELGVILGGGAKPVPPHALETDQRAIYHLRVSALKASSPHFTGLFFVVIMGIVHRTMLQPCGLGIQKLGAGVLCSGHARLVLLLRTALNPFVLYGPLFYPCQWTEEGFSTGR